MLLYAKELMRKYYNHFYLELEQIQYPHGIYRGHISKKNRKKKKQVEILDLVLNIFLLCFYVYIKRNLIEFCF